MIRHKEFCPDKQCSRMQRLFLGFSCLMIANFSFVSFVAAAADAHGGHHAPGLSSLLVPLINFLAYVGILVYGYKKLGKAALLAKSKGVATKIEQSQEALARAKEEYSANVTRHESLNLEIAKLRDAFAAENEQMKIDIQAHADEQIASLKRDNERRMAGELKRAQDDLRGEIVFRAGEISRTLLAQKITPELDTRLRDETFLGLINGRSI